MQFSDLPPGVTGHESQIAGAAERDETRNVGACRMLGDIVITSNGEHAQVGVECDFAGGEVEGTLTGDTSILTFWWYCPKCGTENEESIDAEEYGPDPDDERDRAMFDD